MQPRNSRRWGDEKVKHRIIMVLGIAAVAVLVIALMKSGKLAGVPVVGKYLTL